MLFKFSDDPMLETSPYFTTEFCFFFPFVLNDKFIKLKNRRVKCIACIFM